VIDDPKSEDPKTLTIRHPANQPTQLGGLNGALYFVSMPADGGVSATNKAGTKFGTGYCDAQCPKVSNSTYLWTSSYQNRY
jgi:hypothetical protein